MAPTFDAKSPCFLDYSKEGAGAVGWYYKQAKELQCCNVEHPAVNVKPPEAPRVVQNARLGLRYQIDSSDLSLGRFTTSPNMLEFHLVEEVDREKKTHFLP